MGYNDYIGTNRKEIGMTTKVKVDYQKIYLEAVSRGQKRALEARPTPMIVGTPTTFMGDDIDYKKKTYFVAGGVCGFASVGIKPARGGFVKYLKDKDIGYTRYYGGYSIPARPIVEGALVQSMEINEAYARGFAEVLRENGIECFVESRMD